MAKIKYKDVVENSEVFFKDIITNADLLLKKLNELKIGFAELAKSSANDLKGNKLNNTDDLKKYTAATEKAKTAVKEIATVEERINKIQDQKKEIFKQVIAERSKENVVLEKGKQLRKEEQKNLKDIIALQRAEVGSIKQLEAVNRILVERQKSINRTTEEGKKKYDNLTSAIAKNQIKINESNAAIGRHQGNVGNYPKEIDLATLSLGELKKALIEARNTSFTGKSEEEIQELKKRIGDLTDTIGDLKSEMNVLGTENSAVIVGGLKLVAAGVEGVVGTLSILGVESDVIKNLESKMTSLIAVTQSLSEIEDAISSGKAKAIALRLKDMVISAQDTVVKWSNVVATNAQARAEGAKATMIGKSNIITKTAAAIQWLWNKAIMANPIGAIIVAITALAGAIVYLTSTQNENIASSETMYQSMKDQNKAWDEYIDNIKKYSAELADLNIELGLLKGSYSESEAALKRLNNEYYTSKEELKKNITERIDAIDSEIEEVRKSEDAEADKNEKIKALLIKRSLIYDEELKSLGEITKIYLTKKAILEEQERKKEEEKQKKAAEKRKEAAEKRNKERKEAAEKRNKELKEEAVKAEEQMDKDDIAFMENSLKIQEEALKSAKQTELDITYNSDEKQKQIIREQTKELLRIQDEALREKVITQAEYDIRVRKIAQKQADELHKIELDKAKRQEAIFDKQEKKAEEKRIDDQAKKQKAREDMIDAEVQALNYIADLYQKNTDLKLKQLEKEKEASENHENTLRALAETRSESVTDNLAFEQKRQAELRKQEMKLEKQKQKTALITSSIDAFSARLKNNEKNALGNTIADVTTLISFISALPAFKDGVIDFQGKGTGTSDSNLALLSKGETVMTAKETAEYKPVFTSIRNGTYEDSTQKTVEKLERIEKAILSKPEYHYDIDAMAGLITEQIKKNNTLIVNHYKKGGLC